MMNDAQSEWQEKEGLAFLPAPDALWRLAPAPLIARYRLLGVPLELATNAPALLEMADEVFGDRSLADASEEAEGTHLRVFLHDAPEMPHAPTLMRMQGKCLLISSGGSLGFGDRPTGFGAAFLTPGLIA